MRDYEHHLFYGYDNGDGTVALDAGETNHAVSVLRIKPGDKIRVADGRGTVYDCLCENIGKREMSCTIQNKTTVPRLTPELTLLVGLPDKEHFETVLEHATALGVARIAPLVMDHCRKPWWGAWEKQQDRFMSKMIVSMKQCLYPYIPQLDAPATLGKIIDECETPIIIADQHGRKLQSDDISSYQKLSCLIGPPGGLSVDEERILGSRKTLKVTIAQTRLRTELATTIMCGMIMR